MNQFLEILKTYGVSGALIVVLVFFGNSYLTKIQKIQTELMNIKMQLTQLQIKLVPADQLRTEIDKAILNHQKIYHNLH